MGRIVILGKLILDLLKVDYRVYVGDLVTVAGTAVHVATLIFI